MERLSTRAGLIDRFVQRTLYAVGAGEGAQDANAVFKRQLAKAREK